MTRQVRQHLGASKTNIGVPCFRLLACFGVKSSGSPRLERSSMLSNGWIALMSAAMGGHLPVVDRLLERGADPSAAMQRACFFRSYEAVPLSNGSLRRSAARARAQPRPLAALCAGYIA